jgi:hypothetical protein
MILAAHQPIYFPDLSFFAKMIHADRFVLTDDFAYSTRPAINRARIKTATGPHWLSVPSLTRGLKNQLIRDVRINNTCDWCQKHFRSLQVNYTYAAYFEALEEALTPFYGRKYDRLLDLNIASIDLVRSYLDISTPISLTSGLHVQGSGANYLAALSTRLGCDTFLADVRFRNYLSRQTFESAGVNLQFWEYESSEYYQQFGPFIPKLSVLDLLLNEGKDAARIISRNE